MAILGVGHLNKTLYHVNQSSGANALLLLSPPSGRFGEQRSSIPCHKVDKGGGQPPSSVFVMISAALLMKLVADISRRIPMDEDTDGAWRAMFCTPNSRD